MRREAGRLDSRVTLYDLTLAGAAYSWTTSGEVWAKANGSDKKTYLSSIGVGARSAEMLFRAESTPTMQNLLGWQGRFYFPTSIIQDDRAAFAEVIAAQVEPITATLSAYRPEVTLKTFPAVLLEKYLKYMQERPMAIAQESYILIVPKAIALEVADLVSLPGLGVFHVDVPHRLDPARNEYEITRQVDI